MRKKELMVVVAVCMSVLALNPFHVMAAETDATEAKSETIEAEEPEGDGYEIIEGYDTARSKETPCCVSAETLCPDGFCLNTYVLMTGEDGRSYRISMSAENGYTGQIYLEPGHYYVTEVSVYDDYKQEYPFDITEKEFMVSENENHSLSFRMRDIERIQNENKNEAYNETGVTETDSSLLTDEVFYDTGLSNVTMQGTGFLYYDVGHTGEGLGTMECVGNAAGEYKVVVKIVKTGVIGEAVFQISVDGGISYIGQDIVSESNKLGDYGLTLYFKTEQDTMEFIEGDEYRVSVPETFPVIASKVCGANLIVKGHALNDHDLTVTILSSGGLGKSRFTVESSKGTAVNITDVIPEDGVYELEDDLILVFSDSEEYERGITYTVTVSSNDDTVNYIPLYILLGIVLVIGTVILVVLSGKKDRKSEYHIQKYAWRKDEKYYE